MVLLSFLQAFTFNIVRRSVLFVEFLPPFCLLWRHGAKRRYSIPKLMILFRGLVWDATNSTTFGNNTLTGIRGPGRGLPWGSTDQAVPGVGILEWKFQTCLQGWGPYTTVPGNWGNQGAWGEYRSDGVGGSHLGIVNFSGPLSSGLEPYCGVKCSKWVHFPATILYWQTTEREIQSL